MVVLKCGHISLKWPLVKVLGSLDASILCDTCNDWIPLMRNATAADLIGVEIQPLPEEAPF